MAILDLSKGLSCGGELISVTSLGSFQQEGNEREGDQTFTYTSYAETALKSVANTGKPLSWDW